MNNNKTMKAFYIKSRESLNGILSKNEFGKHGIPECSQCLSGDLI